jgi:hypothetical protein
VLHRHVVESVHVGRRRRWKGETHALARLNATVEMMLADWTNVTRRRGQRCCVDGRDHRIRRDGPGRRRNHRRTLLVILGWPSWFRLRRHVFTRWESVSGAAPSQAAAASAPCLHRAASSPPWEAPSIMSSPCTTSPPAWGRPRSASPPPDRHRPPRTIVRSWASTSARSGSRTDLDHHLTAADHKVVVADTVAEQIIGELWSCRTECIR